MRWTYREATLGDRTGDLRRVFAAKPEDALASGWVVYCADGETIQSFAGCLDQSNLVSLPTLVGVQSSQRHRAEEYLHGVSDRFDVLADFLLEPTRVWAEDSLGLSPLNTRRPRGYEETESSTGKAC